MRTFVSINIHDSVKTEIKKIQKQLPEFCGKFTEFENLHLTLKFLGEIPEGKVGEVKERLRKIEYAEFKSDINYLGFFDNRSSMRYSQNFVVWLHLNNCECLQKKVDNVLAGLFEKEKKFMSHLTIARVKKVENKKYFLEQLNKIKIPEIRFTVDSFCLMESRLTSDGSKYKIVEKYNLFKEKI